MAVSKANDYVTHGWVMRGNFAPKFKNKKLQLPQLNKMKLKFLFFALFAFTAVFAQESATIKGTVTDKEMNNESLPFASVAVKGTTIGATTDDNGAYTLTVPAGTHTLVFNFMGYETAEVKVTVAAGETKVHDQVLKSTSVTLNDVVIERTVNREKETALLAEQQKSIEMKQAIGAQELSRKGVGDAAAAVVKTTGVAKQEGVNNVFVRGLGDRYNSTSLNGLPLPSEDPEYKNISLEFFASNIIKNVSINKTFSANQYADVAGANIDIASRESDSKGFVSASVGTGFNTNAIDANFLVADGNYNYFGFLENGKDVPISNLNNYGFDTSFKPREKNTVVNSDFNIMAGGKFDLGENQSLSLFGVVMNDSEFQYKKGQAGQVNSVGLIKQDLDFERSEYKATQALLGNAKYRFGAGRSISFNTLYIHDNFQTVADYNGFSTNVNDNNFATNSFIRRQQMNNNNLFVNQLLAEYKFSDRVSANAGVAYNMMRGSEPDRRTNSYDYDYDGTNRNSYLVGSNSAGLNNRFFSTLEENDITGKLEASYTFNPESNLQKVLTVGANFRTTERDFEFSQINYDFNNPVPVDINNPEALFNQANLSLGKFGGGFDLVTQRGTGANAFAPFYYKANRDIIAPYAQIVYPFTEKLTVQAGARFEVINQEVKWDTNLSSSENNLAIDPSKIEKTYILPSLTVKYALNEKNTVRFAASQTYTMPQFKETAPFLYEDVNFSSFGNPYLVPSTNYNVDLKYDWYLSNREIISVGALYKYIKDPISRVRIASAANDLSYVNTSKAMVTGVELEVRKNIYSVKTETRENELSFGLNASYLYTMQDQDDVDSDELTVQFTHDKGRMQGASPLLINSDLSYNTRNENTSLTSTVVFAYFADKVYSVGTGGLGGNENIIEKSVPVLDFVNKFDLLKSKLGMSLSVKNILNPKYRLTQETTSTGGNTTDSVVSSYRKGVFFSFGLNWTL